MSSYGNKNWWPTGGSAETNAKNPNKDSNLIELSSIFGAIFFFFALRQYLAAQYLADGVWR